MAPAYAEPWERIFALAKMLALNLREALGFPLDPAQRIFGLYLLTSAMFAGLVYLKTRTPRAEGGRPPSWADFGRFLFPRAIWAEPSAQLDLRYFFFHQVIRLAFYGPTLAVTTGLCFYFGTLLFTGIAPTAPPSDVGHNIGAELLFALVSTLLIDFVSFLIHVAQHKNRILWEFHKVHHSATVMHPLSNYREHPVDNFFYAVGMGVVAGLLGSAVLPVLGYLPSGPTILGVSLFAFAFNALGYNLRHSHVWLRWRPEFLNKVFGCPAHHQVHHSRHQDHIDKNFAFIFPIWDVIFGSFCLPKTNEQLRFGLDGRQELEYKTCWGLYSLPVKKALALRSPAAPKAAAEK